MKKRLYTLWLVFVLLFTLTSNAFAAAPAEDMRGVWVSSVFNLDYPTKGTTDAAALRAQADSILDTVAATGLNTVFLQVRPSSDALYPSSIFPWSRYLTGSAGTAPSDGFDPLAYWVAGAHARGLELHAWVNPYRVTRSKDSEWNTLPNSNPAKQHPEWVHQYTDGNYYYDPGIPEVRQLVVNGVQEILNQYDVDGIHFDDYFYPGTDFNDAATYAAYGTGYSNIGDWRRENVNLLVREVNQAVHAKNPNLKFGISPSGVWENKSADARGSATNGGNPSYSKAYADTLQWIQEGCVDYVIPQIYWHIGHSAADYETLVNWWSNAVQGSSVKLYIGEAGYKCDDSSELAVWQGANGAAEILKHLNLCKANSNVSGHVYFRYGSLLTASNLKNTLTSYYQTLDANASSQPVQPSQPQQSVTESGKQQAAQAGMGYLQTLLLFVQSIIR